MTEVNLESIFSSLETKAARLNEVSDSANQALSTIEKRLSKLNIGLEFWHSEPVDEADSEGDVGPHKTISRVVQLLGLARIGGSWCLALKPVRLVDGFYGGDLNCPYQNQFADGPPVALLSSSRKLRLAALKMMPNFLSELSRYIATAATEIEETTSKLE